MASKSKPKRASKQDATPYSFNISAVARMLNVSSSTLRMWESLGIVKPERTKSGYRRFTQQQVERLKEIQRLKNDKQVSSTAVVHFLGDLEESAPVNGFKNAKPPSISSQLKKLRERRGLTLSQAATKAGISVSFLSGIERNRVSASVATLQKLAHLYETNVLSMFGDPGTARKLVRPAERRRLTTEPGIMIESLALNQSAMEPHLFRVKPGASSGGTYTHEGEEFLFIIQGAFEIWLDEGEHFRLAAGDSLYFSSRQAHRWTNPGSEEALLLWVNTPATF